MSKKKWIDYLQNLTLILLTVSALLILSRLPSIGSNWSPRVQALLSSGSSNTSQEQTVNLNDTISTVHLVVTDNSEYGRYSQLYASVSDSTFDQISPLFREALGSATPVGTVSDRDLRIALGTPNLYIDLTRQLPLQIIAAWLGEQVNFLRNVRAMALTTEASNIATLYLIDNDGTVFRYDTALTVSAVADVAVQFSPNGGAFAFESSFSALSPYTVLMAEINPLSNYYSALPDGYSAYNLLTALEFNPHTNSRYFESSGTEVVEGSPGTLRIGLGGTVSYSGDGNSTSFYQVASSGETVSVADALNAACLLAQALTEGTNASPLYLHSVESTDSGWHIAFRYQAGNIPIRLSGGGDALTVTVTDHNITAFSYQCRSYIPAEETTVLLPPAMATAIASIHPGAGLSICYVDSGEEHMIARWIAG